MHENNIVKLLGLARLLQRKLDDQIYNSDGKLGRHCVFLISSTFIFKGKKGRCWILPHLGGNPEGGTEAGTAIL